MRRTIGLMLLGCLAASAHPMGNFSISHYARFDIRPDGIDFLYALDFAEIPTFELLENWNLSAREHQQAIAHGASQARAWLSGLHLRSDGQTLMPALVHAAAAVQDGAGGLPVLRVTITSKLPAMRSVEYEDLNYPSRTGWKEIVIVPHDGVQLLSGATNAEDRSHALEIYPVDATVAPPQDTKVSFQWSAPLQHRRAIVAATPEPKATTFEPQAPRPVIPAQPLSPSGTVVRGDFLSRMLRGGEITAGMLLIGIAIAFGLGAMHALSPGHGKTIVAAYLVGSRGTLNHALLLGGLVTFTHTAAVFALGIGVLFFQRYVVPEKIIPVLSAASGISIVLIGAALLYRRAKLLAHDRHGHHDHAHHLPGDKHGHHHHAHPGHQPTHGGHTHTHLPEGNVTLGGLIALGVSGGLVPCPSALVLLLSAIALGRVGLGMVLLVAFSTGLALVLMAIGAIVLYAKNFIPERVGRVAPRLRYLPLFSAALVTFIGLLMTGVAFGLIRPGAFIQ